LAHCSDDERAAALKVISETGGIDARGVTFSSTLLQQVLAVASRDDEGRSVIKWCRFDQAAFDGASFRGLHFSGVAGFGGATFSGVAGFDGASFSGDARFHSASFSGVAGFYGATFSGVAEFGGASFSGDARFHSASFSGDAGFHGASFSGDAGFGGASFSGDAWFNGATFSRVARFYGATFSRVARFYGAVFRGSARFSGVKFEQTSSFGPVLAHRDLVLDDVEFARRVRIEASAAVLSCLRARFPAGVQFRLRWAQVVLDDADFPAPSTLSGISHLSDEKLAVRETRLAEAWRRFARLVEGGEVHEGIVKAARRLLTREVPGRPHLLSLRGANVAGLALNGVALDDCRFAGAHNLDKLRLEDDVSLTTARTRLGRFNWDRRQVTADECAWRAGRSTRWAAPWWPDWIKGKPEVLEPGQIAGLYRALRKGREDNKDEPGAADFYYGEMEMRRRARRTGNSVGGSSRGWAERALLTAYWLVSGYGLRAWRSVACLGLASVALALAFHCFGFRPSARPDSYWQSLLYTFRTMLSLRDPQFGLTAWGSLFQALLRITGPVLLGLAALAFRGRVRR
jgi:uncharacterized protein YjbI with pentapeptide repeats